MALEVGETLNNRYRIVALLGQGGMGAVYRAWDLNLKRGVALKENADRSPEAARQFEREATMLAQLAHANLPRVTDHFSLPDRGQYLVMDYVEGEDLESLLAREGALPEAQAVDWVAQVCDALAYLHRQKPPIIHRDIKPANIRVTPDGRAMLVDFGIAKQAEAGGRTTVGARAVTPGFSPPEQYGDGATDARSDTYALGATLYHLLTGRPPTESIKRMVGMAEVVPPRQVNPAISPSVEAAVMTALALPTDRRFQDAAALRAALTADPHAAGPVRTRKVAPEPAVAAVPLMGAAVARQAGTPVAPTRRRGAWAAGALVLLLLATLAGFLLARGRLSAGQGDTVLATPVEESTAPTTSGVVVEATTAQPSPTPLPTKTVAPTVDAAGAGAALATDTAAAVAATLAALPSPTLPPPPPPTATLAPTATPRCPIVEGTFAGTWANFEDGLGCALSEPQSHNGAEERFQFGRMFWRSDAIDYGQALVAFDNGTWRIFEHAPFVEGSPDFKCTDANTPAECPPTPKRGFGMMWCDIGAIRSGLGNATECERPYAGTQQTFQRGFILRSDSGTFVFFNDGAWQRE